MQHVTILISLDILTNLWPYDALAPTRVKVGDIFGKLPTNVFTLLKVPLSGALRHLQSFLEMVETN